jgi:hypothetical protein
MNRGPGTGGRGPETHRRQDRRRYYGGRGRAEGHGSGQQAERVTHLVRVCGVVKHDVIRHFFQRVAVVDREWETPPVDRTGV